MGNPKKEKKKKLFLLLTSNPILPHPHPPLTQHGAAMGVEVVGKWHVALVQTEEVMLGF